MVIKANRQLGGDPPDNANEALLDSLIRHQVGLLRLSGSLRNDIFAILDASENDLSNRVQAALRGVENASPDRKIRKMVAAQKLIKIIRDQAWAKSAALWRDEITELAKSEAQFMATATKASAPVVLEISIPSVATLVSVVRTQPFEGRTLSQWSRSVAQADVDRLQREIGIGVVQGETNRQIARRLVGTVAQRGRDGLTEISRRNAAGITRTAVNAIANGTKREFYKANSDLFEEELYVATLDGRTTAICKSLDGKFFPVGEGPLPPLHFNCRSLRIGSMSREFIGKRPARSFTQRQLLREFSAKQGITTPSSRSGLPRGTKGAFDTFARERKRQLTGRVDGKVTYQSWLERQPKEFVDDTLGPTRSRLFRKGELKLDRFVNRAGDELTLKQLAQRDASAFRAAGLDPEDFT